MLRYEARTCYCGLSGGKYSGIGAHSEIWGAAIPIGFTNDSFERALIQQPTRGAGSEFTAFIIPKQCENVKYSKDTSQGDDTGRNSNDRN